MATDGTPRLFSFKYVNTQNVKGVAAALPALSIIVVALRFLTRRLQNMKIGMDDWLILNGLVFLIAMGICLLIGAEHDGAFGAPTPPLPAGITPEEEAFYIAPSTVFAEKLEYAFTIFMMLAYGSIKLSIISFYRRLFVVCTHDLTDILTKIFASIILCWTLAFLFLVIFSCGTHFAANWGPPIESFAFCPVNFTKQSGLTISDFILDVFIFGFPLPVIWRLRLSAKKKLAVSGILLLAATALGASIARMILYHLTIRDLTNPNIIIDPNLVLTVGLYWSMLEAGLSLIAACLPTFSFLFKHTFRDSSFYSTLHTTFHNIRNVLSLSSTTGRPFSTKQVSDRSKSTISGIGRSDIYEQRHERQNRNENRDQYVEFDIA